MSLILDALNKAQRERQEQQEPVPQLSTVHYTPSRTGSDKPGHYRKGAVAGGVLVLCLAAFLGGRWLSVEAPVAEEAAVESPLEQPQAVSVDRPGGARPEPAVADPARQASVAPVRPASPLSSAPQDVTQLYQQPEEPEARSAAREGANDGAKKAPVAEATAPANAQTVPQRAASETAVISKSELKPEPKPENTVAPPASRRADSITALTDLPFVQDLSWATQQKLPSIIYADHRFQESPAARSVVINGNTYRKGGQIGQGVVLEDILRDGIVLQFQGQRFKLQALNSWVNF